MAKTTTPIIPPPWQASRVKGETLIRYDENLLHEIRWLCATHLRESMHGFIVKAVQDRLNNMRREFQYMRPGAVYGEPGAHSPEALATPAVSMVSAASEVPPELAAASLLDAFSAQLRKIEDLAAQLPEDDQKIVIDSLQDLARTLAASAAPVVSKPSRPSPR